MCLYTAVIMFIFNVTHSSIEYYETTSKHSAFVSKKESYFKCIALLKLCAVACVSHGVIVDQVTSFFGLVMKFVLALSCCKKKQNKKHFYRCITVLPPFFLSFLFFVLSTAAVKG